MNKSTLSSLVNFSEASLAMDGAAINCLEMAGLPVASVYFRRALAEALVDSVQIDDRVRGDDGAANELFPASFERDLNGHHGANVAGAARAVALG